MRWQHPMTWFTIVLLAATTLVAQSQVPPPSTTAEFDVVSIKPATFDPGSFTSSFELGPRPNGDFRASLITVDRLLLRAFGLKEYQLIGAPTWIKSDFFAIQGKAGDGRSEKDVDAMLQHMLRSRFGLHAHSETREMPSYVLTIAREDGRLGSRMRPASTKCLEQVSAQNATREARLKGGVPPPPPNLPPAVPPPPEDFQRFLDNLPCGVVAGSVGRNGAMRQTLKTQGMEGLVGRLSSELGAPVVDATGLTGLFDFDLEFVSERRAAMIAARPPSLSPSALAADIEALPPPLPEALQRQLGLKMVKSITPVQVLVIDSIDQPTPD